MRSAPGAVRAGLLSGHISSQDPHNPFDEGQVEWWEGASLVKVIKQGRSEIIPEQEEKPAKPTRGRINTFSRRSRRRMMLFLGKVRMDGKHLPLFGTTTYPDMFPEDAAKFKRDLQAFLHRLKRRFPEGGILWRLEFKRRKSGENVGKVAPHFHWFLWNVPQEFPFQAERGKWAAMRQDKSGGWGSCCVAVTVTKCGRGFCPNQSGMTSGTGSAVTGMTWRARVICGITEREPT